MVRLLCLLTFLGERFAFLFYGGQPHVPVPLCHFVTFPPLCGGNFPRPRSLLKKAGENFILAYRAASRLL